MNYSQDDLQQALLQFINNEIIACGVVQGVIQTVNNDFTCDIKINDNVHNSVPICVLIGSQGSIYQVPVVGSNCLVLFRDRKISEPQILFIDQVDQLLINCQTLVKFNGGKLGGMVKVLNLVDRLNILENDLNTVKQAFINWIVTPNDGGAALKAISAAWAGNQLIKTLRTDIENTAIQQ